jgi:hypothetical protein
MMRIPLIPRRSRKCYKGQEPLNPGEIYFSRITISQEEVYERRDFCPQCWENEPLSPEAVSWKGDVPKKSAKEKAQDKAEAWLEALREALEGDQPDAPKEALLIALFLKRKRLLIEKGELKGKILFEAPETEELFLVPKVTFTGADFYLQEQVGKKL